MAADPRPSRDMTAPASREVLCGNCGKYHPSADDVRFCYDRTLATVAGIDVEALSPAATAAWAELVRLAVLDIDFADGLYEVVDAIREAELDAALQANAASAPHSRPWSSSGL